MMLMKWICNYEKFRCTCRWIQQLWCLLKMLEVYHLNQPRQFWTKRIHRQPRLFCKKCGCNFRSLTRRSVTQTATFRSTCSFIVINGQFQSCTWFFYHSNLLVFWNYTHSLWITGRWKSIDVLSVNLLLIACVGKKFFIVTTMISSLMDVMGCMYMRGRCKLNSCRPLIIGRR